ncbi:MAG: FliO/MopB family protein [Catenulispora sp.]
MIELVLRIGFSLLVVFGLMWGLAKVAKRPLGRKRGTGALGVLSRQQLSRGSAVAVVQVADRALILGVTDQQVSLLGETGLEAFGAYPHERRDHLTLEPGVVLPPTTGTPATGTPVTGARGSGRLDGSLLSPRTWRSTLDFLRDRTMRH